MGKILIATSIAPFDIQNQQKAVETWLNAGFDVISCNIAREIELIRPHFPKIRFFELSRSGEKFLGKPYPYVYDIFQVLKEEDYDVCGFINSDIHISNFPEGLLSELYNNAMNGAFIYAHRIDTLSLNYEDMQKGYYYYGIDIFIFHKKLIDFFPEEDFCIGRSVWDYWAIVVPYLKGVELLEIKHPIFYHIKHDVRWQDSDDYYTQKIIKNYFGSIEREDYFAVMTRLMARKDNAIYVSSFNNPKVSLTKSGKYLVETIASINKQIYVTLVEKEGEYIFTPQNGHIYTKYALHFLINMMETMQCDKIVCASTMVSGDIGLPPRHIKTFYINENVLIARNKPEFDNKCWNCAIPMSDVSNFYILCRLISKLKRIILYSASATTKWLLETAQQYNIEFDVIGICDKNYELSGSLFCGYEVFSPEIIKSSDNYKNILIASYKYEKEIFEELSIFVPSNKLVKLSEIIKYEDLSADNELRLIQEEKIQQALSI